MMLVNYDLPVTIGKNNLTLSSNWSRTSGSPLENEGSSPSKVIRLSDGIGKTLCKHIHGLTW